MLRVEHWWNWALYKPRKQTNTFRVSIGATVMSWRLISNSSKLTLPLQFAIKTDFQMKNCNYFLLSVMIFNHHVVGNRDLKLKEFGLDKLSQKSNKNKKNKQSRTFFQKVCLSCFFFIQLALFWRRKFPKIKIPFSRRHGKIKPKYFDKKICHNFYLTKKNNCQSYVKNNYALDELLLRHLSSLINI